MGGVLGCCQRKETPARVSSLNIRSPESPSFNSPAEVGGGSPVVIAEAHRAMNNNSVNIDHSDLLTASAVSTMAVVINAPVALRASSEGQGAVNGMTIPPPINTSISVVDADKQQPLFILTPRREQDLYESTIDTPVGESAHIYRYYCPLCMEYFKDIFKSNCCGNYSCILCLTQYITSKRVVVPSGGVVALLSSSSASSQLSSCPCPHCTTPGLQVSLVLKNENVRDYARVVKGVAVAAAGSSSSGYSDAELKKNSLLPAVSPVRVGDSFEALKRKMVPFQAAVPIRKFDSTTPSTSTAIVMLNASPPLQSDNNNGSSVVDVDAMVVSHNGYSLIRSHSGDNINININARSAVEIAVGTPNNVAQGTMYDNDQETTRLLTTTASQAHEAAAAITAAAISAVTAPSLTTTASTAVTSTTQDPQSPSRTTSHTRAYSPVQTPTRTPASARGGFPTPGDGVSTIERLFDSALQESVGGGEAPTGNVAAVGLNLLDRFNEQDNDDEKEEEEEEVEEDDKEEGPGASSVKIAQDTAVGFVDRTLEVAVARTAVSTQ